jgi:FAD/FMN-containing dehydrogenase
VAGLIDALIGAVGRSHVIVDDDLVAPYVTDWTHRFGGPARAVVRPGSTDEVAAVLRACRADDVPVVTQGGNTGLVGGSVPRPTGSPPVVLTTGRLNELGPVDELARQVTVGAGATIGRLQQHVGGQRLAYGVDLASRDSATVGGTVATNAGGLHVVASGDTRAQVVGVEAVLADGSVLSQLSGLAKDSTGYDLPGLLVGSEGTLAVITAVRLRLHPARPPPTTTLVGVANVAEAIARVPRASVQVAEIMFSAGIDLVCAVTGLPLPLQQRWPVYLLLETDDLPDLPDDVDAAIDPRLRDYRERHTEAIATRGVAHKLDVAVPVDRVAELAKQVELAVRAAAPAGHAYEVYMFGHLATGNLHVNVIGPPPDDVGVDEVVLRIAAGLGGTIAAEHGIGVAKTRWLHLTRSAVEIELMHRIKTAFDPAGMLNPGVLLD